MVKVANIKVEEFNLHNEMKNKNNKDMQLCLKYLSKLENFDNIEEQKKLLPEKSKFTVSFELKNTYSEIANGIRRCLTNEISVYSLTFNDYKSFDCNDEYILSDFIKKQIELLPISQDFDDNYKKIKLSLHKTNHTDEIIDVTSSDFTIIEPKESKESYKIKDILNPNIILTRLRPDSYITINDIIITKGFGLDDFGKYNLLSNITYKIIDQIPLEEERYYTKGTSSLTTTPTHFLLSYSTHRNIKNPKKIMKICCDTLIKRLNLILTDMINISNNEEQYFSDLLELSTDGEIKIVHIKNENFTLSNMISKYCYIQTKGNIKFITPSNIHPEKNVGVIKIIHDQFSTIIQDSIKKIIVDLNIIGKEF
jgi:hypothetical protein